MSSEGVSFHLNSNVVSAKDLGSEREVIIKNSEDKTTHLRAETILVAMGMGANLGGLGLKGIGVDFNRKGLKLDNRLRTTQKHIYGAGDVTGRYLFTHAAGYEGGIVLSNAVLHLPRKVNYTFMPWCTYTDPELARAGLTEAQAREKYGDDIRIYRWEHKDVDRAKTDLATEGISKFICDKKGLLLGIHILGHGAAELMHEAQLAKSLGLPFSKIASVIHAYPSYSDAVRQPAKRCYIDVLQNKFFIKMLKKIVPGKDKK